MLRAFGASGSGSSAAGGGQSSGATNFNVDAAFIERQKALYQRRQQGSGARAVQRSSLKEALFPSTAGGEAKEVPKLARADYEKYMKELPLLLGVQAQGAELNQFGLAVWRALLGADLEGVRRSRGQVAATQAAKDAIVSAVGPIDDKHLPAMLQLFAVLQGWQKQLGGVPGRGSSSSGAGGGGTGGLARPFGWDMDFRFSEPPRDPHAAVLAMCGGTGNGAAVVGQDRAAPGNVQELQRMMRAGGQGPAPTPGAPPRLVAMHHGGDLDDDEDRPKGLLEKKYGPVWLRDWAAGALGHPVDDEMMGAICTVLFTVPEIEEAASQLHGLLGDGALDMLPGLAPHRASLVENLRQRIAAIRGADEANAPQMPSIAQQFTVKTTMQKLVEKQERKERRKGGQRGARQADVDWLLVNGFSALVEDELMEAQEGAGIGPTLVVGDLEFKIGDGSANMPKALPAGTTRKQHKGYEEVLVPAIAPGVPGKDERKVMIEEMPEWAQLAFLGYTSLNRIQSRIYPVAFNSNENLLVCAPTGAGKTNIAMISVLREVGANMAAGNVIQRNDFKMVYVAPMKALAAEVTAAFSKRLAPLGLTVRELTGDMQLSKRELAETQMIVTTPEKWDVITRKGGDVAVAGLVRLLIIDEVHLLNDERGAVIESLVARTKRQVESSQSMIRIVGLSATLPNYRDVASFLGANLDTGLFYFDASYRPVPLQLSFIGVSEKNHMARMALMDELCYDQVLDSIKRGHQAMVFVHARKDTGRTARTLQLKAQQRGDMALFECTQHERYPFVSKDVKKSRNREVQELFDSGLGIHHAGMLRSDRSMMERLFADGLIKVLCCTATLAWGVNLPAHTVIIKGTQVYDAQRGRFTDLGMLDVQQIFGRAGRPQFQDTGEGIILTTHDKLSHYLGMLTNSVPIESQFEKSLVDNLNAEIVLGTVTNVREAVQWMSYTYMHTRMLQNPLAYGVQWAQVASDPMLEAHRRALLVDAARELEKSKMARFDERSGGLYVTEMGRVASHFYIRHATVMVFNELLHPHMGPGEVLSMMAKSAEFENVAVREDELDELDKLSRKEAVYEVKTGSSSNKHGKVNILMQAYVSRARIESFSLTADMMYVSSNAPRIARALYEICLRRGWAGMTEVMLNLCKSLELRLWEHHHPLRQFEGTPGLSHALLEKLEDREYWMDELKDMDASDIGSMLRHPAAGKVIKGCVDAFPALDMSASLSPITRSVLRVVISIKPTFTWKDRTHGQAVRWLMLVEDGGEDRILHSETWQLTRKMAAESEPSRVTFTIPITEPLPSQYYVRMLSDSWLHSESVLPLVLRGLILPLQHPPHTTLLDLDPLPLSALGNPVYESMYRFSHFNPIQTQAFHVLYHSDESVLVGAPTGSGKTITSELTMLRLFNAHPGRKVVYVAPLKALVRERITDWGKGLCKTLGKKMVELTGDYTPDVRALLAADIIICTPEKWDGISRSWKSRGYVRSVGLVVLDEIHLLGADRGPILEVIVSRMRYIAAQTGQDVRFVGLSTALANAHDLATWLGIRPQGLFNFKPSVRPVPLECHIQGYPGKFYCPRMATMNKPAYAAVQTHSPTKPVLVFVSSRRQTRLTALDLIAYAAADERPHQWVHCDPGELAAVLQSVSDANLRHTLQFGVGLHHAGLNEKDRSTVEGLYVGGKIQVLVATSTLAWGVNTPAHLVIIKGTEFYDAPTKRYQDFPITDVLQMMGRAGRPQFDHHGVAVIMVHEPKKMFYKKFLYEPFPVESSLPDQLADHLNAEIVGGSIATRQQAVEYLTWTYFFVRVIQNPSYYDLEETHAEAVSEFLTSLVEGHLAALEEDGCIELGEDEAGGYVLPTTLGRIASFYYLQHATAGHLCRKMHGSMGARELLEVLCGCPEYGELPVRHNEDKLNADLAQQVRYPVDLRTVDDPHTKAHLLLQAHMGRGALPISDYITDTKTVLDNSLRLLQAMVDVAADAGWLATCLGAMQLVQMVMQARWVDDSSLLLLPGIDADAAAGLARQGIVALPQLLALAASDRGRAVKVLAQVLHSDERAASAAVTVAERLPLISVKVTVLREGGPGPAAAEAKGGKGMGMADGMGVEDGMEEGMEAAAARGSSGGMGMGMRTDPADASGQGGGGGGGPAGPMIEVELARKNRGGGGSGPPRVYAPRYPKIKEEGWWVLVGHTASGELLAMKRIALGARTTARLALPRELASGADLGGHGHAARGGGAADLITVYFVSDSYLGLDQQYDVPLRAGAQGGSGAASSGGTGSRGSAFNAGGGSAAAPTGSSAGGGASGARARFDSAFDPALVPPPPQPAGAAVQALGQAMAGLSLAGGATQRGSAGSAGGAAPGGSGNAGGSGAGGAGHAETDEEDEFWDAQ